MQTLLRWTTALVLGLSGPAAVYANLLNNPGAEAGSTAGWVVGGASDPQVDSGQFNIGIVPHTGAFAFVGNRGPVGSLSQSVDISGLPGAARATVSFWQQGLNQGTVSDNSYVSLSFLDAALTTLGMVSTAVVDSHDLSWQQLQASFSIPSGTASILYTMHFVRHVGTDLDSYIDDNALTVSAVPEPGTAVLWSLGMLGLALMARRGPG